jgi:hypothetical protein
LIAIRYLMRGRRAQPQHLESAGEPAMDATNLSAGQDVYMFCGNEHYGFAKGTVVAVSPEGVEVNSTELVDPGFPMSFGQGVQDPSGVDDPARGRGVHIAATFAGANNSVREGADSRKKEIGTIRFDKNGVELEEDRRKRHGFVPGPDFEHDRFMQRVWYGAPECGPWQLDSMPFEERTELLKNWRSPFAKSRTQQEAEGSG